MNGRKKEEYKAAIVCYLLSVFVSYIGLSFPFIFIVIPFALAYSVARGGYIKGGTAAVLSLITVWLFSAHASYLLAAAFLPVAFAAGYAIRSKKRMLYGFAITSAAAVVGAAMAIYILSLISGLSIIDFAVNDFTGAMKAQNQETLLLAYRTTRYSDLITGAVTQEALNAASASDAITFFQSKLKDVLNEYLVSIIGIYSLLGGFLAYVIPRKLCKDSGMDVVKIPAFSEYSLPKNFWLAFGLSWLAAIIGESAGLKSFGVLELTVVAVYSFMFLAQALCFLDFIYRRRGMTFGVRLLIHILAVLILGYFLAFIGLFENIMNLRRRMDERRD